MDLPVWSELYRDFGGWLVSLAIAELGFEGVPANETDATELALLVRSHLEGL